MMNLNNKELKEYEKLREKMINAKSADEVDKYADKIMKLLERVSKETDGEEK
ncbi:hypothetical protein [Lederbergia citri]|uniref:Uncharacterized protein n=1 Tax=Lederbergia citri TaxID=2833580 RepID=A0A942TGH6_9BACI|nr:hypothetical protein [Lederbergia citri]MBS4195742.1 hypothetical protein [Lederbergia citri]